MLLIDNDSVPVFQETTTFKAFYNRWPARSTDLNQSLNKISFPQPIGALVIFF